MKLYKVCLLCVMAFCGCVAYDITVNKTIIINGKKNAPIIQGAELEGNDIRPQTEVKPVTEATIPIK